MKKLFAIIMAALVISSVSVSALADTAPGDASTTTTDPAYTALKQDQETLKTLRQQEKTQRDSIKALTQSNKTKENSIKSTLKSALSAARDAAKTANQPIRDEITQLRQQRQSLLTQIAAAKTNNDTATLTTLKTQLTTVNQQIKADLEKIKSNAPDLTKYKALESQFKTAGDQIKALQTQIKSSESDIKAMNAKIKTDLSSAKTAIAAKDYATADTALKDIISCRQQVLTDLGTISSLKQQVAALLDGLVSTLGAGSSGSST